MTDVGPPAIDGDERTTLVASLDYLRSRIASKLEGLDDVDAKAPYVASGTSIYWLGTHMAAVEINQFQRILAGRSADSFVPPPPPAPDSDHLTDVVVRYSVACEESRRILATFEDLGTLGRGTDRRTGDRRSVRWVLIHMIEETARHAGHLDIIREQIDGTTGR